MHIRQDGRTGRDRDRGSDSYSCSVGDSGSGSGSGSDRDRDRDRGLGCIASGVPCPLCIKPLSRQLECATVSSFPTSWFHVQMAKRRAKELSMVSGGAEFSCTRANETGEHVLRARQGRQFWRVVNLDMAALWSVVMENQSTCPLPQWVETGTTTGDQQRSPPAHGGEQNEVTQSRLRKRLEVGRERSSCFFFFDPDENLGRHRATAGTLCCSGFSWHVEEWGSTKHGAVRVLHGALAPPRVIDRKCWVNYLSHLSVTKVVTSLFDRSVWE